MPPLQTSAFQTPTPRKGFDPISVLIGTSLESFIDFSTFGLLQPDIIPEWAERTSPIATTIGRIAGNVAGFMNPIGAFGLTGKAVGTAFKTFGFSSKIFRTAKGLSGAIPEIGKAGLLGGRVFTGLKNAPQAAATFMLHDTAREFINQTRQDFPDLHEVARAGVGGLITGAAFGAVGSAVRSDHWAKQAVAMGTTFTTAEMINDAADGEDVLSLDYAKGKGAWTFLQGFAMGLHQSRGWKERLTAEQSIKVESYINTMLSEKVTALKEIPNPAREFTSKAPETVKVRRERFKDVFDILKEMNTKLDLPPEFKEVFRLLSDGRIKRSTFIDKEGKSGLKMRETQIGLHDVKDLVGMPDDVYRKILKDMTGKSSTKEFKSQEEYAAALDGFDNYLATNLPEVLKKIGSMKFGGKQLLDFAKSPERWLLVNHFSDIPGIDALVKADQMRGIEMNVVNQVVPAMQGRYVRSVKESGGLGLPKQPLGERIKGRTSPILSDLSQRLQHTGKYDLRLENPKGETEGLAGEAKKVFLEYRQITKIMHARTNEVWTLLGHEPMGLKEFYQRHFLDFAKMTRAGIPRSKQQEFQPEIGAKPERAFLAKEKQLSTAMQRRTPEGFEQFFHDDPFKALQNMFHHDLKAIYLHRPQKLAEAQVKQLQEAGALNAKQVQDLSTVINWVAWKQPTPGTKTINDSIVKSLEKGKIMPAVDKALADFGVDLGHDPMGTMAGIYGSLLSKSFIGFRPRQALRNLTQIFQVHGYSSALNLGKGMSVTWSRKFPAALKEIMKKSPELARSRGGFEEDALSHPGSTLDKVAFSAYKYSHIRNVETTMATAFFQTEEYITKDKHGKLGWSDKAGRDGRKIDSNYRSPKEREFQQKEIAEQVKATQYMYDIWGMPLINRSGLLKPFAKFTSWPMNYTMNYWGGLWHRMVTGRPSWAGVDGPKLPAAQRLGAVKHLIGGSLLLAGIEEYLGLDYSQIMGFSITPKRGIKTGALDFRAPPGLASALALKDMAFSNDEFTRKEARRSFKKMLPIPYSGAFKDVRKAITEGDRTTLFFYPEREKQYRKIWVPVGNKAKKKAKRPKPFGGTARAFRSF